MAIWTVLLFYLWLCVVSHYQILGEVMSMGSDKVKVLQEVEIQLYWITERMLVMMHYFQWEDDQAINRYDRFSDGSDGPDPHADDYPTSGPPSYVSQEDVTKVSQTIIYFLYPNLTHNTQQFTRFFVQLFFHNSENFQNLNACLNFVSFH